MPNSFIDIVRNANYDDKQKIAFLEEGLEKRQSSLDEQGLNGENIIHAACLNGGAELLGWLTTKKPKQIEVTTKDATNPLFYAVMYNNKDAIEYFLKQKCGSYLLQAINADGNTVLFFAAWSGNVELFKQLQSIKGDSFLIIDDDHSFLSARLINLLEHNIRNNHFAMFKFLLETYNPEIIKNFGKSILQIPNKNGLYLFYLAAANDNLAIVRYLLDYVFDPDHLEIAQEYMNQSQENEWGGTAIHIAAIKGHLNIVKFLAEHQVEFNQPAKTGRYPLHFAAEYRQLAVIEYLITDRNVDINQCEKNKSEKSPLFRAIAAGHLSTVEFLIKLGAKFDEPNKEGRFVLHEACFHGHLSIISYFVEKLKVDINQPTINNFGVLPTVALSIAAENGYLDIVQYLILKGAVDLPTYIADSALHATAYRGQLEVADWLIRQGGKNVNSQGNDGRTILHIAAHYGHLAYLKFIIEKHRANYMQVDNARYLPFHVAIARGHLDIVKYFLAEKGLTKLIVLSEKPKSTWQLAFENKNISVIAFFYEPFLLYTEEIKSFFRQTSYNNKFILIYCILANTEELNIAYDQFKSWQIVTDLELHTILEKFKEELFQHAKVQREFMRLHNCDFTTALYIEEAAKLLRNVVMVCKDFNLPALCKDLHNEILSYLIPNPTAYKKISPHLILDAMRPKQQMHISKNEENENTFLNKISARIRFFDRLTHQLNPSQKKTSPATNNEEERITKKQRV